jgi:hypothetical protein
MMTCLPIKLRALLPETESEMSIHATQVSAWGEVRIKHGACLMYLSSEAPTGDKRRADTKVDRCVVSQTQGLAGMCGTSMTLRKDIDITALDLIRIRPRMVMRRQMCLSAHATSEEVGTWEAAMKMPVLMSIGYSRMMPEVTSSRRCLFISRSISGMTSTARIEDPAGGTSLTPQRNMPWSVCLPLHLQRARVDRGGVGAGADGARGTEAAAVLLKDLLGGGAATAEAGARFF